VTTFPTNPEKLALAGNCYINNSTELLGAIRALPAKREVTHCATSFQVPAFALYGECPVCGTQIKVRSFSGDPELEDVFDAVFEWMSSPDTKQLANSRVAEIECHLHE